MKHTLYKFIVLGLGLIVLTACKPGSSDSEKTQEFSTLTIEHTNNKTSIFQVEIANTPQERAKGLMNRKEMPLDNGMLFLFPETGFQSFWMKNTFIPLDIIFINDAGTIGHIHHNAIPHDTTGVPSQIPTKYVLEINGGQASAQGISIGDKIFHEKIKRTLAE